MRPFAAIAIALLGAVSTLACYGCPALMVPSLAYQGYKSLQQRQANEDSLARKPERDKPAATRKIPESEIE